MDLHLHRTQFFLADQRTKTDFKILEDFVLGRIYVQFIF